ncbi:acyltransferase [Salinimicrobium sp. CAU 1759]
MNSTKVLRFLKRLLEEISNKVRIFKITILYPKARISYDNKIGCGCSIKCTDDSKLILNNCSIGDGTIIHVDHGGIISIKDTFIGSNCVIVARNNIMISSHCQIAEMVVIRDQNHNFGEEGKIVIEQGFTTAPIVIKENVWLAAKVTVLAGSEIGNNTVVGANAVVNTNLEANAVYVGVPAKKIKNFG